MSIDTTTTDRMDTLMSNKNDNRLSKSERKNITKTRKFAKALTKDGDMFAPQAAKVHRQVKAGRY